MLYSAFRYDEHPDGDSSDRCVVVETLDAETEGFRCFEGGDFAKDSPCPWPCDRLAPGGSGAGFRRDFPGTLVEEVLAATNVRQTNATKFGQGSRAVAMFDYGCGGRVIEDDDAIG